MVNMFQYLQDKKGKPIPLEYKILNGLPLNEDDLIIDGNLYLWCSKITSLPDNLTVNGYLGLQHCNITSLPNNLTVNGWLDISGTQISKLPDDLYVKGNLWCIDTPLAEKIKKNGSLLKKYQKQVKGDIYYD